MLLVETFIALAFWLTVVIKYSCEKVRSSKLNFNQSDFQAKDLINQLLEDSTLTEDKRNGFKEKLKTIPESTQQNDFEDRLENCVNFSPNSAYPSLRWLVLKFIIMNKLISHKLEILSVSYRIVQATKLISCEPTS